MSILNLFGKGTISTIGKVADDLFTSDEERMKGELDLYIAESERIKIEQSDRLAQIEVNKQEAAHRSLFVAGWRPALGWVCTLAIAYHFIIHDMIAWIMKYISPELDPPPDIDIGPLIVLLTGMLGLAINRSFEKMKGVAATSVTVPNKEKPIKKIERTTPVLRITK